jgi:hypothetical protein
LAFGVDKRIPKASHYVEAQIYLAPGVATQGQDGVIDLPEDHSLVVHPASVMYLIMESTTYTIKRNDGRTITIVIPPNGGARETYGKHVDLVVSRTRSTAAGADTARANILVVDQ